MNFSSLSQIVLVLVTLVTLVGTCWNAYQHTQVLLLLAEMRLNMQREMNGKYIRIDNFNDLKERVRRLEHIEDAH